MRTVNSRIALALFITTLASLTLSGCATHSGEVGWLDQPEPPTGEYRVIQPVSGRARSVSVLGIPFDTKPSTLYAQARENLFSGTEVGDGRAIVHRTVDVVNRSFPPTIDSNLLEPAFSLIRVYHEKTVHFSGDLVKIQEDSD